MKNKKGLIGIMMTVVIITCSSCGSFAGKQENAPILLSNRKVEFMTEKVIKKDIENKIIVNGSVCSKNVQNLFFEKSGKLTFYDVYVGKNVKKGDIVATINTEDIEYKMKIAKLKIEKEELRLARAKTTGDPNLIRDAEVDLMIQQLELERVTELLNTCSLIAKFDGIVSGYNKKNIGNMVTQGNKMVTILDNKNIEVQANLRTNELDRFQVGDSVELIVGGERYKSEVIKIIGNNIFIKIPSGISDSIVVSSSIKVIKTEKFKDLLLVPKVGVFTDGKGRSNVQVLADGRIITKYIKLGVEVEGYYEILEGVEEGEEILVK